MNSITKLFNIELMSILGKGRAKKGMFEGDLLKLNLKLVISFVCS